MPCASTQRIYGTQNPPTSEAFILNILFSPLYSDYKTIRGSIAAGTCLRLRVLLPRNLNCCACRLILLTDSSPAESRNMYWESTDGYTEWWGTDIVPDKAGLIFYHFEFDTPFGTSPITKGAMLSGKIGTGDNWQLTVYQKDFSTPEWIKGGMIYQIFPDRFYCSGCVKKDVPEDRVLRNDWGGMPVWEKDGHGEITNNDYFCGDLRGIEEKLPYIASLGVTCIYLNPIVSAHSNHRYNVADYMKTDVLLGTDKDFSSLCRKAGELEIRIMTDGVFSHTGSDSIYFNKEKRYGNGGAYNDSNSPYRSWYRFNRASKYGYDCWWNVPTLPEVNENDPSFTEFITGENGVIAHWLKLGAQALRLDVADELPDAFLDNIRKVLKSVDPDAFLLGEVWEDASNKISYGERRRYLTGKQLDSVMNYPFREAIIDFLLRGNAEYFAERILTVCENYPAPVLHCLMNNLGTHDTERILTVLGGINCSGKDRRTQSRLSLNEEQLKKGVKLMRAAYAILYTLPGVPSLYYGDEILMQGCRDPFNRGCFDWSKTDSEFTAYMRSLGKIRAESACLKHGSFDFVSSVLGCTAYIRRDSSGDSLLTIANMNNHPITYYLNSDLSHFTPIIGGTKCEGGVNIDAYSCAILK